MVAVVVVVMASVLVLVTAVGNGFEGGWFNGVGDLVLLVNRCRRWMTMVGKWEGGIRAYLQRRGDG